MEAAACYMMLTAAAGEERPGGTELMQTSGGVCRSFARLGRSLGSGLGTAAAGWGVHHEQPVFTPVIESG